MHRFRWATLVLALAIGAFPGCTKKEIRIGGLATISGPEAAYGTASQHGFELAFAECNAKGGIRGHKVRLVMADDGDDDLVCTQATQKLVAQEKVVAVLGPNASWLARTGARVCQQAKVPLVATTASDPAVTQVGDFVFRACQPSRDHGDAAARFAFGTLKARTAAGIQILYFNNPYTKVYTDGFAARFTSLGGRVVVDSYGLGKDSSHVLDGLLAAGPDLLYVAGPSGESAKVAREAREKGFRGRILGTDSMDSPAFLKLGGPAAEGVYFTGLFSATDSRPEVLEFIKNYVARFGVAPDANAAVAYDASRLVFDSISRAGTTDGVPLRDALKAADVPGVSGRVKFDAARNRVKPIAILQVQAGKATCATTLDP